MQLYSEWLVAPEPEPAAVASVASELGVAPVTAGLLVARGYGTPAAARAFLEADVGQLHPPDGLPDMSVAADRVVEALERGETIGIYGDYDVDGQTSTALLVRGLRALGAAPRWYIPERVAEGYGLHEEAVERLAAEGVDLLITVDCGSGAEAEVARARELGVDVIVTDHHEPGDGAPSAAAFINPKRADSTYPFRELAGVGVAWKLMQKVWEARGREGDPPCGLELVALGTVADVCPLVGENRVFVREGLQRMNAASMPALTALAEVSGVEPGGITAGRIAFGLAPRLNAAGRIGHAAAGVELLLTDDYAAARVLARRLDEENRRRREMEADILSEAVAKVEAERLLSDWVIVVAGDGWHPGVIGIVASRLVERYARPAVVIGMDGDEGTGSARSIDAFDLYGALTACASRLLRFGGHRMAAGLTVRREEVAGLRRALNDYAAERLSPGDLVPKTRVDAVVALEDVNLDLARELERLAPFGAGNPTPVLAAEGTLVVGARTVGRSGDHLKLTLKDGRGEGVLEAMGFGSGPLADAVAPGTEVDAAFGLRLDRWQGRPRLTLVLRALQSPLARAEREAALTAAPASVVAAPVSDVRGRPVPVADRRRRAAVHPLARAAYLAPLADDGARIVAVVGPGDDGEALADSIAHTLQVEACRIEPPVATPSERVSVVTEEAPASSRAGAPPPSSRREAGSAGAAPGWSGRGHFVLFGLPAAEEVLWPLLLRAAVAPGWTVHLAYGEAEVEASRRALARRFPGREALRVLYRTLRALRSSKGGFLPGPEPIAAALEAERTGLVDVHGVVHGLIVFEQLGLVERTSAGRRLVSVGGRKVDVDASERYNIGVRVVRSFAQYSRIALGASPAALLALAAERSPADEFAFPHSGSAGFSQAGG